MKNIYLPLILISVFVRSFAQVVINPKGTKIEIDTSKWTLSGSNIYNKNSGNVGIGTSNPLAQLHTTLDVRFEGIGTNTSNTKILTTDGSGNVTTRLLSNLLSGNAITSLNGLTGSTQTFTTGTTGTNLNIVSAGSVHTFNLPDASASNRGALSTADWSSFNGKESALTFSTGLTRTTNTITVNTSQNINTLSNLTSNGLIKTSGGTGALSIATSGTDYSPGTSALATGILKSTTATGALSIAVAGDFPTLNQNTTGSSATLTTPRNIHGGSFNGSADLTNIIASTYGGTGNGFAKLSGPATSEKTFTLPNASATILTDNAAVTVGQGGTGQTSYTDGQLLIGNTTGNTLTKSTLTAGSGISVTNAGGSITIANTSPSSGGTVTSVAALTLGTTGTDLSSTVATGTTTPVITLNVPTASASNRGALSTADWSSFNGKESALTFSTGLTRTTNTITVNTSQNINTLSNLTSNGLIKTSGGTGALSIATSGTDYSPGTSALATGILKSTTATGALSIAVAGDFPTLNQNTTGSAATLTTPRNIHGGSFNGSADLTNIIASTYGGTGNGFAKLSGPATSEKTFTLPNASATILTDNAAVTVGQGGTGQTSYTDGQLLIGNTTGNTLTKSTLTAGSGISVTNAGGSITIANTSPSSGGTVTSVAALTLGTTGTDLSSTVATGTTTPVITLNVPTASASNRGALSTADWSSFNGKESALTFSTGLTRTTNTITVNTSQNINTLSNLTSNGLIKTSGGTGALSIATSGTDYSLGTSALATGILKSTTATGALSIAVAGDFPTLNQNTTGSSATLTTPRNIHGGSFNGSADITNIIASTYGGTGNGFAKLSGPATSEKTFTLPNASATILTDNAAVTAAQGGTGNASYTVGDILYSSASTTLSKLADVATGNALISGGTSTAPSWGKIGLTTHVSGTLPIANGGTNSTASPTDGGVTYGDGSAYQFTAAGTSGQVLKSNGSAAPSWSPGVTIVTLGSDVTNNNSTANTIADVTGLSFSVTAGVTYNFHVLIIYTSAATTTGSRWSINGPAAPTLLSYTSQYSLTATTTTTINASVYDIPAASNASSTSTAGNIALIDGIIKPSANGTVIVRFASEIANSAIVAKAGSTLTWW